MEIEQLSESEVAMVSGGTVKGAYMTLGGAGLAVVGAIVAVTPIGVGIGGVLAIGGAAIGALGYAYDHYSSMHASIPIKRTYAR